MFKLLDFVRRLVIKCNATFRLLYLFPFSGQRVGKPLGPVSVNNCCVGFNWPATFRLLYLFPFSGQRVGKPLGPVSVNNCCVGFNWPAYVKVILSSGSRKFLLNNAIDPQICMLLTCYKLQEDHRLYFIRFIRPNHFILHFLLTSSCLKTVILHFL